MNRGEQLVEPEEEEEENTDFFRASAPYASESTAQVSRPLFLNFTQNVILILCSKFQLLTFQ
jgi:hypothetical protein